MKSRDDFKNDKEYTAYLRSMFAMAAMQGTTMRNHVDQMFPHEIAKRSIEIADELLKQLEQ